VRKRDRAIEGPQNEALQQTRSALTTTAAALAAERRCSADISGGQRSHVP
jgi:DNA-binding FadR family transcriptional regulator